MLGGKYFEPLRETIIVKFVATHAQSVTKECVNFLYKASFNVLSHAQWGALLKRLQTNATLRLIRPTMSANNGRCIYELLLVCKSYTRPH